MRLRHDPIFQQKALFRSAAKSCVDQRGLQFSNDRTPVTDVANADVVHVAQTDRPVRPGALREKSLSSRVDGCALWRLEGRRAGWQQ